jgi:proteasome lid subunit RPN8/RPN11
LVMLVARPRIVKETRRAVEEREPPEAAALRPHDWLSGESREAFEATLESGRPFDLYLSDKAERKLRLQAIKEAPRRLEVLGFLLGDVNSWQGATYVRVRDVGTTSLKSSSSKVRFDPEALPKLFHDLDGSGFDYILVGWYHSHPGHTCFLSRTDLDTQRAMFSESYHSALVVDPINRDIKVFRLAGNGYQEIPFAIFPDEAPDSKRKQRRRKLKVRTVTST